jgi:hypothetical protein
MEMVFVLVNVSVTVSSTDAVKVPDCEFDQVPVRITASVGVANVSESESVGEAVCSMLRVRVGCRVKVVDTDVSVIEGGLNVNVLLLSELRDDVRDAENDELESAVNVRVCDKLPETDGVLTTELLQERDRDHVRLSEKVGDGVAVFSPVFE